MSGWAIWRPRPTTTAAPRWPAFSPSATARRWAARAWRWRAAGWPAWRRRATSASPRPDEPATRAALRRALAFQDALWTLFRPPRLARGHSDRRNHRLPLRGGHRRPPPPGTGGRPDLAAGAEEGDARRHGSLPGPLLRRHDRPALPRRARRLRVRRAARAAAPGAGRAADVRGAGVRGAAARTADRRRCICTGCRRCRRRHGAATCW